MADVALFEYDKEFVGKNIEPSPLMMPVRQSLITSKKSSKRTTS